MISMMDIHNKDVQTLKRVKTLLEEKLGKGKRREIESFYYSAREPGMYST